MAEDYVGSIVLELDSQDIDVVSVQATHELGRKLVKTMNRTGRAKGTSQGVRTYSLKVTAVVPKINPPDWDAVIGAKISIESEDGTYRESYVDCTVMESGKQYDADNEARIDLTITALNYVKE